MNKIVIGLMGLVIGVGLGIGGYALVQRASKSPATNSATTDSTAVDTKNWKTLQLSLTGSTLSYPQAWLLSYEAVKPTAGQQAKSYSINESALGSSQGSVTEYDLTEWLKGPSSDEGYVLQAGDRAALLNVMKDVYAAEKLDDALKQQLSKYSVEFVTYSSTDRVYMDDLASQDGKARGFSMINTHGQSPYLESDYQAALYNPEKNAIVTISMRLSGKEFDQLRARYGDYSPSDLGQIDKDVHSSFVSLIQSTPRSSLSFAGQMDTVNTAIESWSFK